MHLISVTKVVVIKFLFCRSPNSEPKLKIIINVELVLLICLLRQAMEKSKFQNLKLVDTKTITGRHLLKKRSKVYGLNIILRN